MYLTQKEQIEQELNQLKSHLEQSLTALDGLENMQAKFTDLEQNYQAINQYITEAKAHLNEIDQLRERMEALERVTQLNWQEWNNELVKLQDEFDLAKQNFHNQFSQQLNQLKQELEKQDLEKIKAQFRQDLEKAIKQLGEVGFNPSNLKKIDKFANQILETRNYCLQLENQLNRQKNWLVIAILTALLALGFSGALIISQLGSTVNNSNNQEQSLNYFQLMKT